MKKLSLAALLLVAATVLGATVLREPVADAATAVLQSNIVGPLDGNGNVKVHEQGTASVQGTVSSRPAAPGSTWFASELVHYSSDVPLAGPTSTAINITSLTASTLPTEPADLYLDAYTEPGSADTCDTVPREDYFAYNAYVVQHVTEPFSVAFPTPLRLKAPEGKKVCLVARTYDGLFVSASGFFDD